MNTSNRCDEEKIIRLFLDHSLWSVHKCSLDTPPIVPEHSLDASLLKLLHPSNLCFHLIHIDCGQDYFNAAFSAEDELVMEWLADQCEVFYEHPLKHMIILGKALETDVTHRMKWAH
jgi:hypothetical protein